MRNVDNSRDTTNNGQPLLKQDRVITPGTPN